MCKIFCLLFTLIFVTTITLHIILPKQSALAIKEQEWEMLLEQKDFIQAVNKVEQHWEKDYENYYNGYCNEVLWPIFHYRLDLVDYSKLKFESYKRVNKSFFS